MQYHYSYGIHMMDDHTEESKTQDQRDKLDELGEETCLLNIPPVSVTPLLLNKNTGLVNWMMMGTV